jgi:hypothetical protein
MLRVNKLQDGGGNPSPHFGLFVCTYMWASDVTACSRHCGCQYVTVVGRRGDPPQFPTIESRKHHMACNKTEPVYRTHRLAFHGTGAMHSTALYTGEVAANRSLPELLPAVMKISTHTQLAEKQTSMRDFFSFWKP